MALRNSDTVQNNTVTNWSRADQVAPIVYTTGDITVKRKVVGSVQSTNNKQLRPWSPLSYELRSVFGGPHTRLARASYYGYPVYNWYDQSFTNFAHPFAYVNVLKPPSETEATNIAQAKLLASLQEARTQWQLAVTLGEARETARLIANTGNKLARGYLAFRKGRISESWSILRGREHVPVSHQFNHRMLKRRANDKNWRDDLSSAWMEYAYAWTPLLGDIDSAAKYLAEKHVRGYFPVQDVSRAHRAWSRQITENEGGAPSYSYQVRLLSFGMSHSRYTYELYPDWARRPSTLNELGFTDPVSVAWNLMPLSFVVDWFVNVGQVLESLHEFRQWGVKRGITSCRTTLRRQRVLTKNWTKAPGEAQPRGNETHGDMYLSYTWASRAIVTTLPTSVPLRVKVDNPFDLKTGNLATAVILLRYAFNQPRS